MNKLWDYRIYLLVIAGLMSLVCNGGRWFACVKLQWQELFTQFSGSEEWGARAIATVYSVSSIGYFIVPCGLIFDSLGVIVLVVYGLVLSFLGNWGIYYCFDYNLSPIVYGLIRAMALQGGLAAYLAGLWTNSKIWPTTRLGFVNSILMAGFSAGAMLTTLLYKQLGFDFQAMSFWTTVIVTSATAALGTTLCYVYRMYERGRKEEDIEEVASAFKVSIRIVRQTTSCHLYVCMYVCTYVIIPSEYR